MSPSLQAAPNDYVSNLDLPDPAPQYEAVESTVAFSDERQVVTVGAQLTEFSEAVASDTRAPISDSMLLAQLAANKAASQSQDLFGWYGKYTEVLQTIGWQMQDLDFQTQDVSNKNIGVHQAIIPVIMAMLGPALAAASMIVSILKGLQDIDKGSPWITLFDQKSQHAQGAKFQISYADANENGDPEIKLLCFGIDAQREITQVLFFKFSADSAKLKQATAKLSVNMERLNSVKEAISKRVQPFIVEFVKNIEI